MMKAVVNASHRVNGWVPSPLTLGIDLFENRIYA